MLSNTQLVEIVYGNIDKRIVVEEILKGRKRELTSTDRKRR